MKYTLHHHRNSDSLITQSSKFKDDFEELTQVIKNISENDLKTHFIKRKEQEKLGKVKEFKSISVSINNLLKSNLIEQGWEYETPIFLDTDYSKKRWRLDFTKNNICIEVAFNHREAVAHNILKPVISTEQNLLKKDFNAELGIVITAKSSLKRTGNFDSAIGTYEDFIEYFKPYSFFIRNPLIIIGLEGLETFKIDKISRMPSDN